MHECMCAQTYTSVCLCVRKSACVCVYTVNVQQSRVGRTPLDPDPLSLSLYSALSPSLIAAQHTEAICSARASHHGDAGRLFGFVTALTNREIGVRGVEYAAVIGALELCHHSAMPGIPAWDWPTDVHTHPLLLLAISTLGFT